ncbi:MAG: hypothetical protein K0S74_1658 [Chlamydiales bacterium]|jgi:hypothetical protein|nr:hypothetical protein [Chlamydiales bacterium]
MGSVNPSTHKADLTSTNNQVSLHKEPKIDDKIAQTALKNLSSIPSSFIETTHLASSVTSLKPEREEPKVNMIATSLPQHLELTEKTELMKKMAVQIPTEYKVEDFFQTPFDKCCNFLCIIQGLMFYQQSREYVQKLLVKQDQESVYFQFPKPRLTEEELENLHSDSLAHYAALGSSLYRVPKNFLVASEEIKRTFVPQSPNWLHLLFRSVHHIYQDVVKWATPPVPDGIRFSWKKYIPNKLTICVDLLTGLKWSFLSPADIIEGKIKLNIAELKNRILVLKSPRGPHSISLTCDGKHLYFFDPHGENYIVHNVRATKKAESEWALMLCQQAWNHIHNGSPPYNLTEKHIEDSETYASLPEAFHEEYATLCSEVPYPDHVPLNLETASYEDIIESVKSILDQWNCITTVPCLDESGKPILDKENNPIYRVSGHPISVLDLNQL